MLKIILALGLFYLISGCATEARISEYQECSVQGMEIYPVKSVPQSYMDTEYFQRQEGMTCITTNNVTNCEPNLRTYQRQVQKTRYIDPNATSRITWIEQCANQQCIKKFGNSDCESNKKSTSSSKPSGVAFLPEMTSGCKKAGYSMGSKEMNSCMSENFKFFNQGYNSIENRFSELISKNRCSEAEVFYKYLPDHNKVQIFKAKKDLENCK
jgi:hypothetical protein